MMFVVEKHRLERMIRVTRDDQARRDQGPTGPYFRIEATDGKLKLTGREAQAEFPSTVYEPGVLFLRVTAFRRLLRTIRGEKMLTIQANADGLLVDNVCIPLESQDMLLYSDPARAPMRHPEETMADDEKRETELHPERGTLWEENVRAQREEPTSNNNESVDQS